MKSRNREAGQSLLMVAFSMVAFLALMGLAIDVGYLRYVQRQLQTAADNAALAAAIQIPYAITGGISVKTAALAASSENNFTDGVNGVKVSVCDPPGTLVYGSTCPSTPFSGGGNIPVCTVCAQVTVTDSQVPTFFAKNFGAASTLTLSATSVAQGGLNCIYALDTATAGEDAIDITISVVDSSCGVVDNSNLNGVLAALCAPSIELKGSNNLIFGATCGSGFSRVKPVTIATAAADPLINVPAPFVLNPPATCTTNTTVNTIAANGITIAPTPIYCGGTVINGKTGIVVTPGTYWGSPAFSITNSTVTFQAGTYNIISKTFGTPGIQLVSTGFLGNTQVSFGAGTYTVVGGIKDNSNFFGSAVNWNNTAGTASLFVLDGGGLSLIGHQANGTGSIGQTTGGVTFYNTGTATAGLPYTYGTISSFFDFTTGFCGANCQLSAPTSGTYAGILFFNDRSNTATASCFFGGTAGGCFTADSNFNGEISHAGAYYFSGVPVNFDFDFGYGAPYTFLIAKDINWFLAFTLNNNYKNLPNGSPLAQGTAILVQ